jgi:hypothetical protein
MPDKGERDIEENVEDMEHKFVKVFFFCLIPECRWLL